MTVRGFIMVIKVYDMFEVFITYIFPLKQSD